MPHAGETTGAETVWEAVEFLHAERIGHGIRSLDDPSLVAYLAERQLPVDVSPTSNVCTRCVPSIAEHPLRQMAEAGLFVTLNSDDPPMFGTSLSNEYLVAGRDLGFSPAELAALAANGVRASFLDRGGRRRRCSRRSPPSRCRSGGSGGRVPHLNREFTAPAYRAPAGSLTTKGRQPAGDAR